MRFRSLTIVSILTAAFLLAAEPALAFDFFCGRQRSRNQHCLGKYDYDRAVWPFTTPHTFGDTVIAVAATDPNTIDQQKPFHFRATALTVDHITLDQVGLAIYKSRHPSIVATGRVTHSGGDGGLIGNNVTIRIRAYVSHTTAAAPASPTTEEVTTVASPNEVTRLPPDAFVVWESEKKLWVSRGRPQHISLVNHEMLNYAGLVNFFGEITHLEVELEYRRDR